MRVPLPLSNSFVEFHLKVPRGDIAGKTILLGRVEFSPAHGITRKNTSDLVKVWYLNDTLHTRGNWLPFLLDCVARLGENSNWDWDVGSSEVLYCWLIIPYCLLYLCKGYFLTIANVLFLYVTLFLGRV